MDMENGDKNVLTSGKTGTKRTKQEIEADLASQIKPNFTYINYYSVVVGLGAF